MVFTWFRELGLAIEKQRTTTSDLKGNHTKSLYHLLIFFLLLLWFLPSPIHLMLIIMSQLEQKDQTLKYISESCKQPDKLPHFSINTAWVRFHIALQNAYTLKSFQWSYLQYWWLCKLDSVLESQHAELFLFITQEIVSR